MKKVSAEQAARRRALEARTKELFGRYARVTCGRGRGRGRPVVCEVVIGNCRIANEATLDRKSLDDVIEDVEYCLADSQERMHTEESNVLFYNEALADLRSRRGG